MDLDKVLEIASQPHPTLKTLQLTIAYCSKFSEKSFTQLFTKHKNSANLNHIVLNFENIMLTDEKAAPLFESMKDLASLKALTLKLGHITGLTAKSMEALVSTVTTLSKLEEIFFEVKDEVSRIFLPAWNDSFLKLKTVKKFTIQLSRGSITDEGFIPVAKSFTSVPDGFLY